VLLLRRLGSLAHERLTSTIAKVSLASAMMGIWVYLAVAAMKLVLPGHNLISQMISVVVAGSGGAVVYGLCVSYMNVAEARLLFNLLSRRARRATR
jgi:hypothetical protein